MHFFLTLEPNTAKSQHWFEFFMENSPRNAHLQPSFPSDDNIKAKGVQEHVQHVELKPGQRY